MNDRIFASNVEITSGLLKEVVMEINFGAFKTTSQAILLAKSITSIEIDYSTNSIKVKAEYNQNNEEHKVEYFIHEEAIIFYKEPKVIIDSLINMDTMEIEGFIEIEEDLEYCEKIEGYNLKKLLQELPDGTKLDKKASGCVKKELNIN